VEDPSSRDDYGSIPELRNGASLAAPKHALTARNPLAVGLLVLVIVMAAPLADAAPSCSSSESQSDPLPFGSAPCSGVRPGARIGTNLGGCTIGFLFRDTAGTRYVSTAGHCFIAARDPETEKVWTANDGPVASDSENRRIGRAVFAIDDPAVGGSDFALVRLDPGVQAHASVCYWGGPTDHYTALEPLGSMQQYRYFGQGAGIGEVTPARTGVGFGTPDPDWVFAYGISFFGDSGSPVMTEDGRAVGLIKGGGLGTGESRDSGTIFVPRLHHGVARAQQMLGTTLTLETAPLAG